MKFKICLITAMLLVAALAAGADTITLVNGTNGYDGCEAATITDYDGYAAVNNEYGNYYSDAVGTWAGNWASLIKFDGLSALVPTGSTINSATLNLYGANWSGISSTTSTTQTHSLLKDWYEGTHQGDGVSNGEVTWYYATYSEVAWDTPGALAATDQAAAVDPQCSGWTGVWGWVSMDVTASLQQQATSGNYYGWAIRYVSGYNQMWFYHPINGWTDTITIDYTPAAVPEPGSLIALCTGICGLAGLGVRRRR